MIIDKNFNQQCEMLELALGPGFQNYQEDLRTLAKLRLMGFRKPVIYDIGASNTIWSVVAHEIFPDCRVEMFEPLAELSNRYLRGNLSHPKVRAFLEQADQVTHPIALGSRNGSCRFCRMSDESASTSLSGGFEIGSGEFVDLPMHRLDDYVAMKGLRPPDIIKLDTQGSEIDILKGSVVALASAKAVFVESWLTKGYGPQTPLLLEMTEFLSRYGYFLADFSGEHRSPTNVLNAKDLLYLKQLPEMLSGTSEEITGDSSFSRLAKAGFQPKRVYICSNRPEVWRKEAKHVFPSVNVDIGSLEHFRQSTNGHTDHEILVLDIKPALIQTARESLDPRMAVVARLQADSQAQASEQPFLLVGKILAQRDLHLFDLGNCCHRPSSGFLQWIDVVFLGRSNNISPLRLVNPEFIYRISGLGGVPVSLKDNLYLFYFALRRWLSKFFPSKRKIMK